MRPLLYLRLFDDHLCSAMLRHDRCELIRCNGTCSARGTPALHVPSGQQTIARAERLIGHWPTILSWISTRSNFSQFAASTLEHSCVHRQLFWVCAQVYCTCHPERHEHDNGDNTAEEEGDLQQSSPQHVIHGTVEEIKTRKRLPESKVAYDSSRQDQ